MERVWFDFGEGDIEEFSFSTPAEMNAFLEGVSTAAQAWGIDDYRQYDENPNTSNYYVEVYRPCYPERGVKVRIHKESDFYQDMLHPTMTACFHVVNVDSESEAIAAVLEYAAGRNHGVYVAFVHMDTNSRS